MIKKKIVLAAILATAGVIGLGSCDFNLEDVSSMNMEDYIPYIQDGNWWINGSDTGQTAIGQKGEKGDKGEQGEQGSQGEQGEKGDQGEKGEQGEDGADGKTAYELFCEAHPEYTGTEEQWVNDVASGKWVDGEFPKYKVTFNDGYSQEWSIDVMYGCTIEMPEDPVRPGRVFAGWYLGNTKWNFDFNVVTEAITLTGHWVLVTANPNVYVTNLNASFNSVTFSIFKDEVSQISSVVLYKGNDKVATLEDLDNPQFDNLLANTSYNIRVFYTFDLGDGFTPREESVDKWFITQSVTRPTAYISNVSSSYTSISFSLWENDPRGIGEFKKAELLDSEDKVVQSKDENLNNGTITFEGLNTNTLYKIVVTYQFDMYDGMGVQTQENLYQTIRTLAYGEPTISFKNIAITSSKISGSVVFTDLDKVGEFVKVSLFKGEVEDSYFEEKDFVFDGLDANSEYKLVVTYKFDLSDGKGEQTQSFTKVVHTHPQYVLTETSILYGDALVEGDTIYLHAYIENDNPAVKFKSVKVNGVECEVTAYSMTDIYVSFPNAVAGTTSYTIEEIYVELDGNQFVYSATENNTIVKEVYNKITLENFEITSLDDEEIKYLLSSQMETFKVVINLDNKAGFEIVDITTNFNVTNTEITENNSVVTIEGTKSYYWQQSLGITDLTYKISETATKKLKLNKYNYLPILSSETPIEVNSVSDFENIASGYSYKLTNDLDFKDIDFTPKAISNIYFDGGNHLIKNLAYTSYSHSDDIGLFDECSYSNIRNLVFDSCAVVIDENTSYNNRVGIVTGYTNYSTFENINLKASCVVSVNCSNGTTKYVGGFVGYLGESNYFKNIVCSASVTGKFQTTGCFSGYFSGDNEIVDSGFTGNVYSQDAYNSNYILGRTWNNANISVKNSYSTGLFNGSADYSFTECNGSEYIHTYNSGNLANLYPSEVLSFSPTTYTFVTNGGTSVESITTTLLDASNLTQREGYYFAGWYLNSDFSGYCIDDIYYSKESEVTLYAKWAEYKSDPSIFTQSNWEVKEDGLVYKSEDNFYSGVGLSLTARNEMRISFDLTGKISGVENDPNCNFMVFYYGSDGNCKQSFDNYRLTGEGSITRSFEFTLLKGERLYIEFDYRCQGSDNLFEGSLSNLKYAIKG